METFRPSATCVRSQRIGSCSTAPFWEGQDVKQAPISNVSNLPLGHWYQTIWAGVSYSMSSRSSQTAAVAASVLSVLVRVSPFFPFLQHDRIALVLWAQRWSVLPANEHGPACSHWWLQGGGG